MNKLTPDFIKQTYKKRLKNYYFNKEYYMGLLDYCKRNYDFKNSGSWEQYIENLKNLLELWNQ